MELPRKRRGGREPVDARKKLLYLLESWLQDFWPLCVAADERDFEQLRHQGEAWLLDQIEKWEVDSSPSRNHKLKFFGGRTVARWASVWSSGVNLVARYNEARLDGTLPDIQHAAQLRQDLLERLSPQCPGLMLAKAERQEADLLQQLKETTARINSLADKVNQSHLDERAAWDQWLSRLAPDALDLRKQQAFTSGIHRQAMEDTEQARQKYLIACDESNKALRRQAELRGLYNLAVVERQLLQFKDGVEYRPEWDAKDFHAPYAGMKFKTEGLSIQGHQVFVVQKLHFGAWVDWVYISQSTIPGGGRGIFAARNFVDGEYIGRYLGRLLGLKAEFTDAVLKAYQSPYLLTVRAPGRRGRDIVIDAALPVQCDSEQSEVTGVVLFEQTSWSWPGMFAHLANDGRHGQEVDRCNSQLQARGHLHATKTISAINTSTPDWAASEILWDYSDGYWREGIASL